MNCYPPGALNHAFSDDPAAAWALLAELTPAAIVVQRQACAQHAAYYPTATAWWDVSIEPDDLDCEYNPYPPDLS
ncbi:hypothetical protein K2Z83_22775 [Oscillochloris sp. ZM17-4]|uniref:hypothetical protein n=1 Tax=Oscillochloris sp. ZM17-4 TaxID=2866714 RepID=UPI001C736161|nr:hypothetical protein [Oscillochloris sp. ZM17-4]MBX0330483.1 hypothetical protein [Oscillochloris sp. ZM17-4]